MGYFSCVGFKYRGGGLLGTAWNASEARIAHVECETCLAASVDADHIRLFGFSSHTSNLSSEAVPMFRMPVSIRALKTLCEVLRSAHQMSSAGASDATVHRCLDCYLCSDVHHFGIFGPNMRGHSWKRLLHTTGSGPRRGRSMRSTPISMPLTSPRPPEPIQADFPFVDD